MRPPSKPYTLKYFSSLGYVVEQSPKGHKGNVWKISGDGLPLDGRTFPTMLLLWAEWMDYAAERIREDYIANHFKEKINKADEAGKLVIASELKQWLQGNASEDIVKVLRKSPGGSTDRLPNDWKKRIALLIMEEDQLLPLWLAINQLISSDSIKAA
ncbi:MULTISPECIES: hypothetical protein [Xanthomonas]|uniref:hypothetical protein n=1 Tax=Xanthomonas TaxID=338 RepID=UPI00159320E8|nr:MULTISPECIES: hypothetical protein [Xanthomonas]NHF68447.1 hypothetical protein [Xanthomonas hortorum]